MARWNALRRQLREVTRAKDHAAVVDVCCEVLARSEAAPDLLIVGWLFDARAAKALAALELFPDAVARIERAIAGCERHRATEEMAKPDDWLRDLEHMKKLRDRWQARGVVVTLVSE